MSMNKAEKARVRELEEALALRWVYTPIKIRPPQGSGMIRGFLNNSYGRGSVSHAASTTTTHCSSSDIEVVDRFVNPPRGGYGGGSREGVALFVTRKDALMDLRMQKQAEFAKILAAIDADIAKEP